MYIRRFFAAVPAPAFFVLTLSAISMPLSAQEVAGSTKVMDEITVTARMREETLQDIPATVYVFTEEDIERSNITRAAEIALLTPGVSLVDAAEAGDTQVNIRGMNGARDAENSYALVIDGIIYTNPASLNREYSNLQQIEVLKGPQGAIYGRNASAGAFIITTRVPEEEVTGRVIASGGEDATYRLVGDVAGPLGDSVRGSLMGEYFTTDGFYENDFLNRDDIVDNRENWALTGRLIFDIGDRNELDTKLRYGEVDASSIAFNSVFHIPFLAGVGAGDAWYEDVNDHPMNFFNNVVHTNDQEATEFSAKWTTQFDTMTLTAWGLYSNIENQLGADGTSAAFQFFGQVPPAGEQACTDTTGGLGVNGENFQLNPPQVIADIPTNSAFGAYTPTTCDGTQYQERNQEDISIELRLMSNTDSAFQWMGGLYYLNIDREVSVSTGIDRLTDPNGPGDYRDYRNQTAIQQSYTTDPSNPTEQLASDQFDTNVYSVFGAIGYDFTDTFTADLALRYDSEERKVSNQVPTVADGAISQYINPCGAGFTPGVDTPLNPGLCNGAITDKKRTFSQFQPKLSGNWNALDSTSFYGSVGVGFRSGGFNNQGSQATVDNFINTAYTNIAGGALGQCTSVDNTTCFSPVGIKDDYDKETSTAAELGFKSNFSDNSVLLEGAVFYNEVEDMQFFEFIVGGFGLLRVVENVDKVELRGVEAGLTWDAASWLDLFVGGSYIDSEIKKNAARPDTVGNESPYTPDYTANLGAYFKWPISSGGMNFFTNLDVSAVGKTWFHVVQSQQRPTFFGDPLNGEYSVARRDAYALANVRLGVESEKWTAALWVHNAGDKKYLEENIPAPEFGGSFAHPGTLRRIGADFTWRF